MGWAASHPTVDSGDQRKKEKASWPAGTKAEKRQGISLLIK